MDHYGGGGASQWVSDWSGAQADSYVQICLRVQIDFDGREGIYMVAMMEQDRNEVYNAFQASSRSSKAVSSLLYLN